MKFKSVTLRPVEDRVVNTISASDTNDASRLSCTCGNSREEACHIQLHRSSTLLRWHSVAT